jgi:hypothetical protein
MLLKAEDFHRKKAALHRSWSSGVYDQIAHQIDAEVNRRYETDMVGDRWREAQDRCAGGRGRTRAAATPQRPHAAHRLPHAQVP